MPIRVLPTHLVNKIAAGEVIERPASVVKELVENALDAGARRIDVHVAEGGKRSVRVADDGCGMSDEDLRLAFAPHATSKLADADDLFGIETMGFRGEALASIASISRAHVRTRRADETGGWEITAAGDEVGQVRPCAASTGTTVTVRDLFFNTPARRKFLRTTNTELGHVTEQIARLALPHPNVAFTLTHNEREVSNLPAAESTARRIADLFGGELADALLPVRTRETPSVSVRGLIAPPGAARSSGKWQYVFVNGRYVRDRSLSHALREAYRGRIDPSRYPVAFLFVTVPPDELDVNVHPTKIEVRFRNAQAVHGELLAALTETLNRSDLTPAATLDPDEDANDPDDPADRTRRESLKQALAEFFKSTPPTQPRFAFNESIPRAARPVPRAPADRPAPPRSAPPRPVGSAPPPHRPSADAPPPHRPAAQDAPAPQDVCRPAEGESPPQPAAPRRTIQVHDSYVVTETDDGLEVIDQHALHERLIYNDLRRRLTQGRLDAQKVLIPEPIRVTEAEADAAERHADLLAKLGIEVEPFGPGSVAVQQFPTLLSQRGVEAGTFLREILDRLSDDDTTDAERLLEDLLEMLACKAAVKAGDPLTEAEIDALLARRHEIDKGASCPHGRPTTIRLTLRELAKQFRRV